MIIIVILVIDETLVKVFIISMVIILNIVISIILVYLGFLNTGAPIAVANSAVKLFTAGF